MLPELLEFADERVLQLVERGENTIGESLAQMPENLLGRVQCWAVGWQIERMHVLWPAHLITAMTARTVQHDPDRPLSQLLAQMVQEELQALAFDGRQHEKDACACGGFHRSIQPQPLVLVLHDKGEDVPPLDTSADAAKLSGQSGLHLRPRAAAAVVALPGCRSFFKGGLLLCIRLLVSSA